MITAGISPLNLILWVLSRVHPFIKALVRRSYNYTPYIVHEDIIIYNKASLCDKDMHSTESPCVMCFIFTRSEGYIPV